MRGQCAIADGGPAGTMLDWLLARAGVTVVVLEKHRDFLRDFRGDTIHPSTLEVLHELGVLDEFLTVLFVGMGYRGHVAQVNSQDRSRLGLCADWLYARRIEPSRERRIHA